MSDEETIFTEALAKESPQERSAFLDQACGGNVELRQRVEVLLAAHDEAGSFLESPPAGVTQTAVDGVTVEQSPAERPGEMVGAYKLLEQIGEGGMGVVFMAEQQHPVRRRVALKIIKPGMDTKQVIARFEAERQALALMDHPNIARVLEAGATDAGRPYFVMELVRGIPITDYCDQQKLSPRQRLDLFVQVCQAVQHAHQKGIIHRDLKPNNVLVTLQDGKPAPKVIDFGIAKATAGQRLTDQTLYTELRQLVGTPLYMSPEQAEMSALMDMDTRSDVYSLGVLLYELLTGTTPFDKQRLAKAAYDEVRRIIREEEPPRPSTRISTLGDTLTSVSAQRQTDPKKLSGLLKGELDWIVMRAMEKDRTRRYDTVSGLAQDVERYLSDQPVEACPPSRLYRLRKMARRNKAAIATGAVLCLVLLLATGVSTWQAVRAKREKLRADEQASIATAVNDFLNHDLLEQASIEGQEKAQNFVDRDLKVREALDRAAARIAGRFPGRPLTEAAIERTISRTYSGLGEFPTAEPHMEAALRLRRQALGEEDRDTLQAMEGLGIIYLRTGQLAKAQPLFQKVLDGRRRILGEHDPDTRLATANMAWLYMEQRQFGKVEPLCLQVLEATRDKHYGEELSTTRAVEILKDMYWRQGQYAKSQAMLLQILERDGKLPPPVNPETFFLKRVLSKVYYEQARYAEAETFAREALDDERNLRGPRDPTTLLAQIELGSFYERRGQHAKAEPLVFNAAEQLPHLLGDHHPATLGSFLALVQVYMGQHQYAKAEAILLRDLPLCREFLGPADPDTLAHLGSLGQIYFAQKKYDQAEPLLREALDGLLNTVGELDRNTLHSRDVLGQTYAAQGKYDKAEPMLRKAVDGLSKTVGDLNPNTLEPQAHLGALYLNRGHYLEAEPLLKKSFEMSRNLSGKTSPTTLSCQYNLALLYFRRNQIDKAEPLFQEYLSLRRESLEAEPIDESFWAALIGMAQIERATGRGSEAERYASEALAIAREQKSYEMIRGTLMDLGRIYAGQRKFPEAEAKFQEYLSVKRKALGAAQPDEEVWSGLLNLAGAEHSRGEDPAAEGHYQEALKIARELKSDDMLQPTLQQYGGLLHQAHRDAEAEPLVRECLEVRKRLFKPGNEMIANMKSYYASILTALGKYPDAEPLLLEANSEQKALPLKRELDDRRIDTLRWLAELYRAWKKPEEAAKWVEEQQVQMKEVVERNPSEPSLRAAYGKLLARWGKFKDALPEFQKAIELAPTEHSYWHDGAVPLLLQLDKPEDYRRLRTRELKQFATTSDGAAAHRVSKDCFMLPLEGAELDQAVALAARGKFGDETWAAQTKGMADYRRGRFDDAIKWLKFSTDGKVVWKDVENNLFIALAHHHLGEHNEAQQILASATKMMETQLPQLGKADLGSFGDWIYCQVMRREAEREINGKDTSATARSASRPSTFPAGAADSPPLRADGDGVLTPPPPRPATSQPR